MVASRAPDTDVRLATLSAAMRLFAAHGFEGTALQDIADEVGVSKPAILHHFPSKEAMRQAVLDVILAHWNDALPRLLLAATAGDDCFDAVFGETCRFFAADADRARMLMREMLDRPAEVRKLLRGSVRPWFAAVAGYIRSGKERGLHYANVDEEAYVVHILLLVLAATAASPIASAALDGDARPRFERELARIAHASLFPSPAASPTATTTDPDRAAARKRKSPR